MSRHILLFLALTLPAAADTLLALRDGEKLAYRVGWGIFLHAGEIKIAARAETLEGLPQVKVMTTTATHGLARMLFPFDASAESTFDGRNGRLLALSESSESRGKSAQHSVVFDYPQAAARYVNPADADSPRSLAMPAGNPLDLITSLLETRTWNMQPGDQRDALVLFDDDFYELTIHAVGYEDVYTPLGMFKALVLEPRMEKTPPKGMFKRGSSVRVWISQDERRLPVRFAVDFRFGAGIATLDSYEPPAAALPATVPDAKNPHP